jgi:hypothetical protein
MTYRPYTTHVIQELIILTPVIMCHYDYITGVY